MYKEIGVLGGSFNPVHIGHAALARAAHQKFNIPKILLAPTSKTYYKDESQLLSGDVRLEMLRIFADSVKRTEGDYLEVSSIDTDRGGITYTCDTVDELSLIYDKIYFIMGSDSLMYIDTWKNADVFLKKCVLLFGMREGDKPEDVCRQKDYLEKNFGAEIYDLEIKNIAVSSASIREMIRQGRDVSGMIPGDVLDFIEKNKLYRPE